MEERLLPMSDFGWLCRANCLVRLHPAPKA